MKNIKNRSQWPTQERAGSMWELLLFTIFFVALFTLAARADENHSSRQPLATALSQTLSADVSAR
ncbi:MAG: hypothetical protein NDI61_00370 [Bdellovibrionaceae bacterium]|nr:hypothetical protein [Pseudobdellovibrionaceae bacterium]